MNRKQRLLVSALTIFMLVWCFDLISILKNGHPADWDEAFNIFNICQIIYVTTTLLLTRWVGNRFFTSRRYSAFWVGMLAVVVLCACQRYLLEQVIQGRFFNIWNYPPSTLLSYYLTSGGYSDYERARAARLANQQSAFEAQQREIAHLNSFIERFRAKATKARQAQSRIKMLAHGNGRRGPRRFAFPFLIPPAERAARPAADHRKSGRRLRRPQHPAKRYA